MREAFLIKAKIAHAEWSFTRLGYLLKDLNSNIGGFWEVFRPPDDCKTDMPVPGIDKASRKFERNCGLEKNPKNRRRVPTSQLVRNVSSDVNWLVGNWYGMSHLSVC